jgi:signal transduction histidine kinase
LDIDWMELGGEFARHVWLCEDSRFIDDLDDDAGFAAARGEIQSLAVLPLRLKSPLHGAIALMKCETHSFGADEKHFLQAMSRQIALALENARLYGATVQANDDLRREIDERTRAEQTLADFTAMVAHDLRSPLSNMVSITDSIREGLFGPVNELQHKWLWKVQESCKSLIGHISDFLDISKIDAGKLELIKAPTDLKALLLDGFLEHSVEADKKRIAFRTEISDDLPPLAVDARRISQVLENLLSNAFKFTQSGGEVLIGAHRWGDAEVVWWVKDSGVGIPPDEFDRIFDTYRQLSAGQKSSYSGTGLGLAICKKVVEAHDGRIWVESEPEKGSTFFVSLPAPREDATGARSYATRA